MSQNKEESKKNPVAKKKTVSKRKVDQVKISTADDFKNPDSLIFESSDGTKRVVKYEDPEKEIIIQKEAKAGNIVKAITEATGIKKAIDFVSELTGIDCGCEERVTKFNKVSFKYGSRIKIKRCPTKEQFELLDAILKRSKTKLEKKDAESIAKIYSHVFGTKFEIWCGYCAKVWLGKIRELKTVLNFYRAEMESGNKKE